MPTRPKLPDDPGTAERYSIDELSALAGVTPRTVRYYIAEGLLDRPAGEKRGAHYLRRHLEQLLLIRRWTDAGLSLDRIRELQAGAPEDPPRRAAPPGLGGGLEPGDGGRRSGSASGAWPRGADARTDARPRAGHHRAVPARYELNRIRGRHARRRDAQTVAQGEQG